LPESFQPESPLPELPLDSLETADREALQLRFQEDLDFDEMAARLKISEAGARQRVSRALRRLRDLMSPITKGAKL
jgi:RNA polymerase sigma factor (sigma-70 family)